MKDRQEIRDCKCNYSSLVDPSVLWLKQAVGEVSCCKYIKNSAMVAWLHDKTFRKLVLSRRSLCCSRLLYFVFRGDKQQQQQQQQQHKKLENKQIVLLIEKNSNYILAELNNRLVKKNE